MTEPVAWSRWLVKKAARSACVLSSGEAAGGARALMYHRIRPRAREPFSVSPPAFERQIAWLAQERRVVSLAAVVAAVTGGPALPEGAVLVTIDDGYRDVFTTALPILQRYGVPAVLFVTVGAVTDRPARAAVGEDDHVSWDECRALEAGGVTVASHGWTHRSLARVDPAEADDEIARSRAVLQRELGTAVDAFAYPFGTRADYSDTTAAALARAGYRVAFTAQHGAVRSGVAPLEVPRIKVEGGEGLWLFRRLVAGGLDRWEMVDRYLWRLQASEPAA